MKFEKIAFESMSFGYEDNQILEDSTYEFPTNCNAWINGFGGSGKSTIMKIMAGLKMPTTGRYFVNDFEVTDASFEEFMPYRLKIGYAMDYGGLLSNKSLRENIALPVRYHRAENLKENLEWVDSLIERFDITSSANSRPAMVRGAMRKATCVVRAFALKPEMLLLDNPTEGLWKEAVYNLVQLIREGRKEGWLKHVFVTTDNIDFVDALDCVSISVMGRTLIDDLQEKVAS